MRWAHGVADRFPDGQLYVNLRGYDPSAEAVRPEAAVLELLGALQVPPHRIPDGEAARAGLYRSLLAGRRMLVLLDNARDADQVAPLLPGAPGCLVVVTSRDHLAGLVLTYGAHPLTLGLLPPEEAQRLLAARIGRDRLAAEPVAAEEIVRCCAGLPLALAIVAARAAIHPEHPLAAMAGELRDTLGALEPAADVRAIFSWSYDTLDEAAARLFRLVAGLHPGPESTIGAAASLAGVPASRVRVPLADLTRANLLTEHAPGRYSCHDLLRAYAAELCEAVDADREAARHRVVDHYVHTAYAAARHLHGHIETVPPGAPGPGVSITGFAAPDQALAWSTAERAALLAALKLAAELMLDRHVCHLARALFVFLHRQGRWHDQAETGRAALAAARRAGDPAEQARAHRNLAWTLADLGHFDDAHHHLDAAVERSRDDPAGPGVDASPPGHRLHHPGPGVRRARRRPSRPRSVRAAGRPGRPGFRAHQRRLASRSPGKPRPGSRPVRAGTRPASEGRQPFRRDPYAVMPRRHPPQHGRPRRGDSPLPRGPRPVPGAGRPVRRGQHPRPPRRVPSPRRRSRGGARALAPGPRPPQRPRPFHHRPRPHPADDHRPVRRRCLPPRAQHHRCPTRRPAADRRRVEPPPDLNARSHEGLRCGDGVEAGTLPTVGSRRAGLFGGGLRSWVEQRSYGAASLREWWVVRAARPKATGIHVTTDSRSSS
ncbi:NB-ARC domain-containing protein [Actinomadura madurae]|nr:NB-ARC domain-containing protein [Actinomadura madurae]